MWKADIAKIIIAVYYFSKMLHHGCLTGFQVRFGPWIYGGSEYVSGSKYARVLNITGFWTCQDYEYARTTQSSRYAWICLNMPELFLNRPDSSRVCLNMSEYMWMCLNMSEWLLLYMSLLQPLVYLNTWLLILMKFKIWRNILAFGAKVTSGHESWYNVYLIRIVETVEWLNIV